MAPPRLPDWMRRRKPRDKTAVTSGPSTSTEISTTSSVVLVSESASRREITHLTPQANLAVGHGKFEPSKSHENEPSNRPLHLPISKGQNLNLTKLYEPEDKPKEAIADILFVHGLTGNAYTTWLHKDKNGESSSNRVSNHAENMLGALSRLRAKTDTEDRKLIFVAHSLGGLVVQCALNLSRSSPETDIAQIEKNTIGLVFLGTPHHGSDYAAWVTLASGLTDWLKRSNKNIVAVLEPDSETLANIQKGFQSLLSNRASDDKKVNVICFFEEMPVIGFGDIVPKHSAIMPAYPSYGIHANHMDMTKFDPAGNPGYEAVEGEIFKWIKLLRSERQRRADNLQDFLASVYFSNISARQEGIEAADEDTLHWIWTRKSIGFQSWLESDSGLFWIAGKAGSGKSTLIKYLLQSPELRHRLVSRESVSGKRREVVIAACFFDYFAKGSTLAKSAEGMLRSLVHELISARPTLFQPYEAEFVRMRDSRKGISWTLQILNNCLLQIVQNADQTRFFFLVDALDEYHGEDAVVAELFTRIAERCSSNLQLCVSSRPHIDFRDQFEHHKQLRMESETTDDIVRYTKKIFNQYIRRHGDNYRVLVDEIISDAQGLFIWVKLASNEILRAARRGEDIDRLRRRLRGMPQELDSFYQRILDQLDPEDREEARAMLAITICSPEPLTPMELRYALHYATGMYSSFTKYLVETRILAVCGGLLEFREFHQAAAESDEFQEQGTAVIRTAVRLAHRSVYNFLERKASATLHGTDNDGEMVTGSVLLLRLSVNALVELLENADVDTSRTAKFKFPKKPLLRARSEPRLRLYLFAFRYWAVCAQEAERETTEVQVILDQLNLLFAKWCKIGNFARRRSGVYLNIHGSNYTFTKDMWPWDELPCNNPDKKPKPADAELDAVQLIPNSRLYTISALLFDFASHIPTTMLELAIALDIRIYAKYLYEQLPLDRRDAQSLRQRILYAVTRRGIYSIAKSLMDRGGLNFALSSSEFLARAIHFNHPDLAKLFIEYGAEMYGSYSRDLILKTKSPLSRDDYWYWQQTPWNIATRDQNYAAKELLLENGYNLTRHYALHPSIRNWLWRARRRILTRKSASE